MGGFMMKMIGNALLILLCIQSYAESLDSIIGCKLPVTVYNGMVPTANALITVKVPENILKIVGDINRCSIQIENSENGKILPAVRKDKSGQLFVAWYATDQFKILEQKHYMIHFEKSDKPVAHETTAPSSIPQILPGMNLIANGNFKDVTGSNVPAYWFPTTGYGKCLQWDASLKGKTWDISMYNGKNAMMFTGKISIVQIIKGLKAGHQYQLSYLLHTGLKNAVSCTLWFRSKNKAVTNYKTQLSCVAGEASWTKLSKSDFVYKIHGKPGRGQKLLADTESGFLEIKYSGKTPAYITDIMLENITYSSNLTVELGLIQATK